MMMKRNDHKKVLVITTKWNKKRSKCSKNVTKEAQLVASNNNYINLKHSQSCTFKEQG